ncbi:MAG: DUF4299 family protein [Bacillota bacterium]|nr:DUF4299 family protein [Bacillota bacterium]
MSLSFYMEHKKKLFSGKAMKISELLDLVPGMVQLTFDESREDFDPNAFYSSRLDEYVCLLFGIEFRSARGFEVSYEKPEDNKPYYRVRIFTPSSEEDWKIALTFTKALALKQGSEIKSEHGDVFTAQDIERFAYRDDILFGIQSLFEQEDESSSSFLFGVTRPVAFDEAMRKRILSAPDSVREFSEIITHIQYLDAYSAKQFFYRDEEDQSVFGLYVLTETVDTILPYKPFVEFQNTDFMDEKDIKTWKIHLMVFDGDPQNGGSCDSLDVLEYDEFIEHLPKEKYEFIDGAYILVKGLDKNEMQTLVNSAKKR